jgi:DNA-binding transcriptional LysR family regulator
MCTLFCSKIKWLQQVAFMLFSRAALYFDEVARRGSVRRAGETLNIAASAIDRQILQLEDHLGVALFERLPQGLRLTAAGELLIAEVRRWRRDFQKVKSRIDDLRGLRRGEVTVALVEGSIEFLSKTLSLFRQHYPFITYRLDVQGAQKVVDLVQSGEADLGLTFNPPASDSLRIERTLIYRLGAVVRPDHPLAALGEIALADCADYPLILPDETMSLRKVFDEAWAKCAATPPVLPTIAGSLSLIKSLTRASFGVGLVTALDVYQETASGELAFLHFKDEKIPLSTFSLISASGRLLSVPASLLLQHLSATMLSESVPAI